MRRLVLGFQVLGVYQLAACGSEPSTSREPSLEVAEEVADSSTTETNAPDTTAPPVNGVCGDMTFDGRCEGTSVVYCESPESGVATYDCAPEYECAVVDGYADCRLAGSEGCGRVTFEGYCDGSVAVYCNWEITEVVSYDCASEGLPCGYVDDELGYYCIGTPESGAFSVRGAFFFEKPAITVNGLGAVREAPVRNAIVQVRRADDDELVASGTTDENGTFEIALDEVGEVYALAVTAAENDRYSIFVRDCPLADCEGAGYVHAVFTENFTPSLDGDIGGWLATREINAGAFNIFDMFVRGQDFAWTVYAEKPPTLVGQWALDSETSCGDISCFVARSNTVYINGLWASGDEFDDPVIGHEFGHYLEHTYSRSDSPGGYHDGSPTDPRLAWGEGYGTFVGSELLDSPLYIDSAVGGAWYIDISNTGVRGDLEGGPKQLVSEFLVAELLWTLSRGGSNTNPLGSTVIFDVLRAYFPAGWFADRGVQGVDLVDFLDGLICRGGVREELIRRVAIERLEFPYDFGGPRSCR